MVKKQIRIDKALAAYDKALAAYDKALAAYRYAREQARARDGINGYPLFVVYSYGNPWVFLMDRAGQELIEAKNA